MNTLKAPLICCECYSVSMHPRCAWHHSDFYAHRSGRSFSNLATQPVLLFLRHSNPHLGSSQGYTLRLLVINPFLTLEFPLNLRTATLVICFPVHFCLGPFLPAELSSNPLVCLSSSFPPPSHRSTLSYRFKTFAQMLLFPFHGLVLLSILASLNPGQFFSLKMI